MLLRTPFRNQKNLGKLRENLKNQPSKRGDQIKGDRQDKGFRHNLIKIHRIRVRDFLRK